MMNLLKFGDNISGSTIPKNQDQRKLFVKEKSERIKRQKKCKFIFFLC